MRLKDYGRNQKKRKEYIQQRFDTIFFLSCKKSSHQGR